MPISFLSKLAISLPSNYARRSSIGLMLPDNLDKSLERLLSKY